MESGSTKTIEELASKHGIRLRYYNKGSQKVTCPKCSHQRAKKDDPCLSIRIDENGLGFRCFNCNWSGGEYWDDKRPTQQMAAKKINKTKHRRTYGDILSEARSGWVCRS